MDSHLDRFSENCGDITNEQGERFHHGIKDKEDRYKERWYENIMAVTIGAWNRPKYRSFERIQKAKVLNMIVF